MTTPDAAFVATILDRSATAYAAHAAGQLLEAHPDVAARYGRSAFAQWRDDLTHRIHELGTAIELQTPDLLAAAVRWSRDAFVARGLPPDDLRAGLASLRRVLAAELPQTAAAAADAILAAALQAFDSPAGVTTQPLDPRDAQQRLALDYIAACLEGDTPRAGQLILDAVRSGHTPGAVCLEVLAPALAEVGRLWHADKLGVHEEHCVTAATHRTLGLLAQSALPAPANGKTVVGATVQGNAHDTAVRILTFLFELDGWKAVCLGTELPPEDLARSVCDFDAELVVLSATLVPQLRALGRSVAAIRSASPSTKILAGGLAFAVAPELATRLGADAPAAAAHDVVHVGRQLVGLD